MLISDFWFLSSCMQHSILLYCIARFNTFFVHLVWCDSLLQTGITHSIFGVMFPPFERGKTRSCNTRKSCVASGKHEICKHESCKRGSCVGNTRNLCMPLRTERMHLGRAVKKAWSTLGRAVKKKAEKQHRKNKTPRIYKTQICFFFPLSFSALALRKFAASQKGCCLSLSFRALL